MCRIRAKLGIANFTSGKIPMNMRSGPLALVVFGLACVTAPAFAQIQPVTLAWDATPESSVAGYIVYVGNASGSYQEQYDVSNQLSFVYTQAIIGRPYYFAVAAYAPGPNIGPRSGEVFFLAGAVSSPQDGTSISAQAASARTSTRQVLCAGTGDPDCYVVDRLASLAGNARSLTPAGDGRLFFIEDGRRVRVIDRGALMPEPALSAETAAAQLAGLVVDPEFARNRFVYVGEVDARSDGSRQLNIVRYREVANVLGEGAVIVAGLPMPPVGDAPFTIDSARRLYVAVPATLNSDRNASPYGGMVLRFESDGTVSRDSHAGSPVLARGYARPTSLVWSSAGNELWLAGSGAEWTGVLARIPLDSKSAEESAEWPRVPETITVAASSPIVALFSVSELTRDASAVKSGSGTLLLVDEVRAVFRINVQPEGGIAAEPVLANALGGEPTSAALDGGDIYIALTIANPRFSPSSQIVRLRRD